jgi:RNA polymerase sigma-70 factor (ECF subfamily)
MSGIAAPTGGRFTDRDFDRVVEHVAPRLYRMAVRMCGNPADAEDLVQETLLQAFRKWPQFEGRSEPSTWMYTIASRLCRRRHRRRAGEPRRLESLSDLLPSPSDPLVVLPSALDSPLETHLRKEAERAVGDAIAKLPAHYRLPLVLADIAELSTPQIARVLGLRHATVKTRIHRARLQIRKVLLQRLPTQPAPPPNHDRQVCLDLLRAKQEALDRRATFEVSDQELCVRCRSLFDTLDLGRDVCGVLNQGDLPPSLQALVRTHRVATQESRRKGRVTHPAQRPAQAAKRSAL